MSATDGAQAGHRLQRQVLQRAEPLRRPRPTPASTDTPEGMAARWSACSAAPSTRPTWRRTIPTPSSGSTAPRTRRCSTSPAGRVDAVMADALAARRGLPQDRPPARASPSSAPRTTTTRRSTAPAPSIGVRKEDTELRDKFTRGDRRDPRRRHLRRDRRRSTSTSTSTAAEPTGGAALPGAPGLHGQPDPIRAAARAAARWSPSRWRCCRWRSRRCSARSAPRAGSAAGRSASAVVLAYTTIVRGIPDLVMLLLVYFGGQRLVNAIAGAVGFGPVERLAVPRRACSSIGFIYGAYLTETFRGAYMTIPARPARGRPGARAAPPGAASGR